MKLLFIGDAYGKAGRNAIHKCLPLIKEKLEIDAVILNAENVTHGKSISSKHYAELVNAGVDFMTLGNHYKGNEDIFPLLRNKKNIIRPINFINNYDGDGSKILEVKGIPVRITNVIGRVEMHVKGEEIDNPFTVIDDLLDSSKEKVHIIDFHGEATGEKKSFARYVDGRVSAVLGTHTHVQTADNQVFPKGTAYISDVGYCGSFDSVLGVVNEDAIAFSKDRDVSKHGACEKEEIEFSAVYLDINEEDGKARSIKRIYLTPEHNELKLY